MMQNIFKMLSKNESIDRGLGSWPNGNVDFIDGALWAFSKFHVEQSLPGRCAHTASMCQMYVENAGGRTGFVGKCDRCGKEIKALWQELGVSND